MKLTLIIGLSMLVSQSMAEENLPLFDFSKSSICKINNCILKGDKSYKDFATSGRLKGYSVKGAIVKTYIASAKNSSKQYINFIELEMPINLIRKNPKDSSETVCMILKSFMLKKEYINQAFCDSLISTKRIESVKMFTFRLSPKSLEYTFNVENTYHGLSISINAILP